METARALSDNLSSLLRLEHGALAEFLVMDRYAGKKARRRRAASARRELAVLPGFDLPPGAPRATSS